MAIAVVYIGQRKFDKTSTANHQVLIELLKTQHTINIYDFTRPGPSTDGPFSSSGGIFCRPLSLSMKISLLN